MIRLIPDSDQQNKEIGIVGFWNSTQKNRIRRLGARVSNKKKKELAESDFVNYCDKFLHKKGGACKIFVQKAYRAFDGTVIPLNDPFDRHRWVEMPKGFKQVGNVVKARRNDVIQMETTFAKSPLNLHTCVVITNGSDGLTVIDSNWKNDNVVSRHLLPWDKFREWFPKVTVYRKVS